MNALLGSVVLLLLPAAAGDARAVVDLTRAVVVTPACLSGLETRAVTMLLEEVEKRTQVHWARTNTLPSDALPVIVVGPASALEKVAGGRVAQGPVKRTQEREGYRIWVETGKTSPVVVVAGNDSRGVLFGVGHLLRSLRMAKQNITLPAAFQVVTSPRYPLRGHQLGYRPKTNSYDGWSLPMWEQYIRDLAVFGANAVELIPPRSDDAADSPHFPLPPMEMMIGMSRLLDEYGLDVWIWYPALDRNYSDPKTVEFALNEWGEVFRKLPRIDAVFVPGGDPGHTQPKVLMALLEKQTAVLHRHHPKAQMWVSPQGFNKEWMEEFLAILKTEPAWLSGVVFGPQVRMPLPQLRAAVPPRYPIRHYPDITHSLRCQYPVPEWDAAFGVTLGREPINPRPEDHARIFRLLQPSTNGFITYSEGCNDDVNKAIWSGLGWNPDAEVIDILRDYSRYFIGPEYTDSFAQGLLALEQNWRGPVLTNRHIVTTLQQFRTLEKTASPRDKLNWRFQQALYRAYYDAYVHSRLIYETDLEERAMYALRQARETGTLTAMARAEAILDRAVTERVATDLRARVFELAEALFQSIRMQLSVDRYQAIAVGRGATLDTIDAPLNNRLWLKRQLEIIRRLDKESARLQQIHELIHWTDPGPGGFYDDLGNPRRQAHLIRGPGFAKDPGFFERSQCFLLDRPQGRTSWWDQALTFYDAPLQMRYTRLDPDAQYKLRVVYGAGPIRLVANDAQEIHGLMTRPYERLDFDLPPGAARTGVLALTWTGLPGQGGTGRGCQVAEVWLMKR